MSISKPPNASGSPPVSISREDYVRIRRKLLSIFLRARASEEILEDLVQRTFLEAETAHFEGNSSLDTFIVGVGKNVWLHHKREQRALMRDAPEVPIDGDQPASLAVRAQLSTQEPQPEDRAADREELGQVVLAIRELPPNQGRPLRLQVEGHSYEEIGRLLGISPDLVSSRIFQARDTLRRKFPRWRKGGPR